MTKYTPVNTVKKKVNRDVYDAMCVLIRNIATDYNLDSQELIKTYLPNIDTIKCKKGRKKEDDLIETEEYTYAGKTYLVDNDNTVYSCNIKNPVILGKKLIDGTIQFVVSEFL